VYRQFSQKQYDICDTATPNYEKLKSVLEDMYIFDSFPYMHIVIDEGQDFGTEAVEETGIIEIMKSIITDIKPDHASFYIFYDKLQLVQAHAIPQYISDADCKLTLYRNCRNTENIATTSLAPITERRPKLIDGCVKGLKIGTGVQNLGLGPAQLGGGHHLHCLGDLLGGFHAADAAFDLLGGNTCHCASPLYTWGLNWSSSSFRAAFSCSSVSLSSLPVWRMAVRTPS
jgi:hypothetical protein